MGTAPGRRRRSSPLSVCERLPEQAKHERWLDCAFRWLSDFWPLNLLIYLVTFPLAELAFYVHVAHWRNARSAAPHDTFEGAKDTSEVLRLWDGFISEYDAAELRSFLRGWFVGKGEPQRGDVSLFVTWTLYNSEAPPGAAEASVVEGVVKRIELALGRPLPPGQYQLCSRPASACGTGFRLMRYTREPLAECHRPLGYYLVLQAAHCLLGGALRLLGGFERRRVGRLHYLVRPASPAGMPTAPVVFLHGVGGLLPYPLLLWRLAREHDGPVLLPLLPSGALDALPSSACASRAMPTDELVEALALLVARHSPTPDAPRAGFLAHSLGTAALAALLKRRPEVCAAASFVDPICFLLHRRDVLFNFMYAAPPFTLAWSSKGGFARWFHWVQHVVMTCDPTVQNAFRREFFWAHYDLHAAQLATMGNGAAAAVHLSAADTVCNPRAVAAHLRRHAPSLSLSLVEGELSIHGAQLCLFPRTQRAVCAQLRSMLAAASEAERDALRASHLAAGGDAASGMRRVDSHMSSSSSWQSLAFVERAPTQREVWGET